MVDSLVHTLPDRQAMIADRSSTAKRDEAVHEVPAVREKLNPFTGWSRSGFDADGVDAEAVSTEDVG